VIHRSAKVDPSASLGTGVNVGPAAVISAHARLGDSVEIGSETHVGLHVVVADGVHIGSRVQIQDGAVIQRGGTIEDGVLLGTGAILANERYPRAITAEGEVRTPTVSSSRSCWPTAVRSGRARSSSRAARWAGSRRSGLVRS
jgi:UDP-3-O-[3-hydroxymyristoyl] glucosamine N-acyltransferase